MTRDWEMDATRRAKASQIDTTVPNVARVGDYLLGGGNNFAADRSAVRSLTAMAPAIAAIGPAARAFHHRAVRFLADEAGIRQFLDVGTGLTTTGNTHEIAQSLAPDARIVYADTDPMVLSHARALMKSRPTGAVAAVDADVRDVDAVISGAARTLDLSRPTAVLLLATLAYVDSAAAAAGVVASLMAAVPSGSYVAVYHLADDLDPALPPAVRQWNRMSAQRSTLRSRDQVAALVAGLDLVPPGVVPITDWRPEPGDPRSDCVVPVHGVLARKP